MVERTGLELVAKVDDREIEGLGRTFQWVRRQTEDVRRSLVGLNSVADRQVKVNRLIRDEKKSQADAEGIVARSERRTLEDRAGGIRRMMTLGQQAGRTVPMAGGGAGGIARGVTGGIGRGVAGRIAGGAGGLGAGAALAGGAAVGGIAIAGLLAARGFGRAKEQATVFEALERRVRAVGIAYGEIQRAVQGVGGEFGVTKMEIAAASEAFTQFAGQIDDVDAFAMAMGGVVAAARGFGLQPEQLAGEIGQFQRLIGFDVTQEPAQTQRFLSQMADVMGRTQMGGRPAELIKATQRLASVAADISGVVAPERVLALQAAVGGGGRQGLVGERGANLLMQIHQAIARPAGEVQTGFMFRALGQGRDPFQTLARMRRGIFGEDVVEDIAKQMLRAFPDFEVPTAERIEEIQAGAELTPEEARFGVAAEKLLQMPIERALAFFSEIAPGGEVKDLAPRLRDISDIAKKTGIDINTLMTDAKMRSAALEVMRSGGEVSKKNLEKIAKERGLIEPLQTAAFYLNEINDDIGGPILKAVTSMSEILSGTLGRFVKTREDIAARPLPEVTPGEISPISFGGLGKVKIVPEGKREISEIQRAEAKGFQERGDIFLKEFAASLGRQIISVFNRDTVVEIEGEPVARAMTSGEDAVSTEFVPG